MGIEISREGFEWARANALLNKIDNAEFLLGDASTIFEELESRRQNCSLVIDPPRKGCDEDFLQQTLAFRPERIIYVSCEPATQARDIGKLLEGGYRLLHCKPFDLFPQTRPLKTPSPWNSTNRPIGKPSQRSEFFFERQTPLSEFRRPIHIFG